MLKSKGWRKGRSDSQILGSSGFLCLIKVRRALVPPRWRGKDTQLNRTPLGNDISRSRAWMNLQNNTLPFCNMPMGFRSSFQQPLYLSSLSLSITDRTQCFSPTSELPLVMLKTIDFNNSSELSSHQGVLRISQGGRTTNEQRGKWFSMQLWKEQGMQSLKSKITAQGCCNHCYANRHGGREGFSSKSQQCPQAPIFN